MDDAIEILLIEDDPQDVRLTWREPQLENVKNQVIVAKASPAGYWDRH